jgi:hypothetical protein
MTAIAQSLPDSLIKAVLGDCARRFCAKTAAAREKKRRLPPDYPKGIEKIYVSFYSVNTFLHRRCVSKHGLNGECPDASARKFVSNLRQGCKQRRDGQAARRRKPKPGG